MQRPQSILSKGSPGVPRVQIQFLPYFSSILLTLEAAHGSSLAHPLLEEYEVSNYESGTTPQCSDPVCTSHPELLLPKS